MSATKKNVSMKSGSFSKGLTPNGIRNNIKSLSFYLT